MHLIPTGFELTPLWSGVKHAAVAPQDQIRCRDLGVNHEIWPFELIKETRILFKIKRLNLT